MNVSFDESLRQSLRQSQLAYVKQQPDVKMTKVMELLKKLNIDPKVSPKTPKTPKLAIDPLSKYQQQPLLTPTDFRVSEVSLNTDMLQFNQIPTRLPRQSGRISNYTSGDSTVNRSYHINMTNYF